MVTILVISVFAFFSLLTMPVGATLVNYDTTTASTRSGGGVQSGVIPGSSEVPAPDNDIYTISITEPKCDVDIWMEDYRWTGDRIQVWVDDVLIGTTPKVKSKKSKLSERTFRVTLTQGDHALQFKNTCEPCFTGQPPCYGGWLPSGFF